MKTWVLAALTARIILFAQNAFPQDAADSTKSIALQRSALHPVVLAQASGATVTLSVALDSALPPVTSGKLELWLKADAGVVTDAFGRVHQCQDQSANRNDALQPSGSLQPLLVFPPALAGRPALRFDGQMVAPEPRGGGHHICIGTYLQGAGLVDIPQAMTSFCVYMLAAPSSREYLLWMVGETNPREWGACRADAIIRDQMDFSLWAYDFMPPVAVPAGSFRIRADRLSAGLDSVDIFDTSASGTVNFTLPTANARRPGAGYYVGGLDPNETYGRNFNGDIAEIIIYNGALVDADRQAVTDYLRDKYLAAERMKGAALQWLLDGTNIAGATNATLILPNLQRFMTSRYSVMVSNEAGVFSSSNSVVSLPAAKSSPSP
jgi:hypothetical protein